MPGSFKSEAQHLIFNEFPPMPARDWIAQVDLATVLRAFATLPS